MIEVNKKYLCKKIYNGCIEGRYYNINAVGHYYITFLVCDGELCHEETFSYDPENPNAYSYIPNFFAHFYTEQEERQLKLKRLNNVKY